MSGIMEVLVVAGLFVLRIGVPVALLLVVGTLIERAYRRREAEDTERPIAVEMQPTYETQVEEPAELKGEENSARN